MDIFTKSKWIWQNNLDRTDEYVEFRFSFGRRDSKIVFNVACDSDYNLFVNGKIAAFGQYSDYPDYKVYDSVDISDFVQEKNDCSLIVWHYGQDTQNYIKDKAGVIFEVGTDSEILAASDENTECRVCSLYHNQLNKHITSQLGLSFKYYGNKENDLPFCKAVLVEKSYDLHKRPNDKLVIKEKKSAKIIADYGDSCLIDLSEETVGFLALDFESETEQEIMITYGEYLFNNQVRRLIRNGPMDFSVEYVAREGRNRYCNYFRRLAGRYLQVYYKHPIKINYIGLLPVEYPLTPNKVNFKETFRNDIYKTCLRTLLCCMHEHYEDCPWREQALYTMDSRNEMLCTYAAFGDYRFARSNLLLISKGLNKDGLLTICYPSGIDIPIPSFSLIYPIQLSEYIEKSNDTTILDDTFETALSIISKFIEKIDNNGLIDAFPAPYWNFYEWSGGSVDHEHGSRNDPDERLNKYDLILNCLFVLSVRSFGKICKLKNYKFDFDESAIIKRIQEVFYEKETQLYCATTKGKKFFTALGNSLAILIGLGDETTADLIIRGENIVPITLSMNTFLYEALLKLNPQKFKDYILNDLDTKYLKMLRKGATTFWETEDGAAALSDTGSLCHGWSSMPLYYYNLLNSEEFFDGKL